MKQAKKLLFGIVAVIVVGIVIAAIPYFTKEEEDETQYVDVFSGDNNGGINIGAMSGEDIYYEPDTILPNNYVVLDMKDMANAYAIMRAAYCDAELWVMSLYDRVCSPAKIWRASSITPNAGGVDEIRKVFALSARDMANMAMSETVRDQPFARWGDS